MKNSKFSPKKKVACDTETTGLRVWHGDVAFAVGMCDDEGETWYCEWPVDPFTRKCTPNVEDILTINRYMADPSLEKVFHNAKFDIRMLAHWGIETKGTIHDTHIAARVANNLELTYGLKSLSRRYLNIPDSDEKDLKDAVQMYRRKAQSFNRKALKEGTFDMLLGEEYQQDYWLPRYYDPENEMCEKYCRQDTYRTMGLHLLYEELFDEDPCLRTGYEVEMFGVWPAVARIENRGMKVSLEEIQRQSKKAREEEAYYLQKMVRAIQENNLVPDPKGKIKPENFNPSSPLQLSRVLYQPLGEGGLGLTTTVRSDSGGMSTDKNALRELMHHEFVRDLVAYRSAKQVNILFFQKFQELVVADPISGEWVLRPGLNQCGTKTFRFSSNDPNLQQVSNPKTAHNVVSTYHPRSVFGPREGYYGYAADFSQQELRIYASISQDPFLLQEINAGRDPNSSCANKAWGGRGNIQALKAASLALDLGKEAPSNENVAKVWEQIEWNATAAREFGGRSDRAFGIADWWLSTHDYDIVNAEKSVSRSNSRGRAKCTLFAMLYGGGPSSLTELLYCSLEQAAEFMNDYNKMMPDVKRFINETTARGRRDGYLINMYGRKIRVEPDLAYKATNHMIQSTAACQVKDSIIRIDEYLRQVGLDAHILMTIHDEILFEVLIKHAYKWLLRGVMDIMQDTQGRFCVPTPSELKRFKVSWTEKEAVQL